MDSANPTQSQPNSIPLNPDKSIYPAWFLLVYFSRLL